MSDPSTSNPTAPESTPTLHTSIPEMESCELITATHVPGGHAFVVTSVETVTETTDDKDFITIKDEECLIAVPIAMKETATNKSSETNVLTDEEPSCSRDCVDTKAIVPLSSSLPSKLLRFHAKRSAKALLHQIGQSQSLDSQLSSDEGAVGGSFSGSSSECANDCADIFNFSNPRAPTLASGNTSTERLDDVGMGSSIEDSEESEVDDELKPLAVDNHVFHDIDLGSPKERHESPVNVVTSEQTAVLSEANLEKFRKNHNNQQNMYHNLDNIYLHPNFKYELENDKLEIPENSPPPAVAPTNSPTEQRRVHRCFLTMKKPTVSPSTTNTIAIATSATLTETLNSKLDKAEVNSEASNANEIVMLDPQLVPSDELAAEIAEAVEFYFSNDSILKDAFLLKHVRRNKEGFVSLKLVSSFKRVRQLTKDWKVVGNAVNRKSRKIELNDLGTKVRRIEPLPNFDETMPSRTIVVCDLPLEKLSIEKVSDIFSKCGEIALIRILKPGMAIPVDVRQFMNKYPEMQQKECALVEYLESLSARDAKNLEGPFQVYDMVAPKKKTGKKAVIQIAAPVQRMVENYRYYNDATYERTRGGSFSGILTQTDDMRHKLKRNNSDFPTKSFADFHSNNYGSGSALHHFQQSNHHYSNSTNNSNHHHSHQQPHPMQNTTSHRGSFGNEHQFHHYQPRNSISHETVASSLISHNANNNNNTNYQSNLCTFAPRRYSNTSTIATNTATALESSNSAMTQAMANNNSNNNNNGSNSSSVPMRRLSNGSDGYPSYNDMTRRASNCSENMPQRRDSNCSESCPCSRRVSDFGPAEVYRKSSQSSIGSSERRFSNGSMQFERTMSNASDITNTNPNMFPRRMSNDFHYDRKQSIETQTDIPYENDGNVGGGGGGWNVFPRRYSNNFNVSNKMAAYDNAQYIGGRRISTDSGYDRRYSFGSEYEGSPRSRTGSFLNNFKHNLNDYDSQPRSRTNSFLDGSPRSRSGSFALRNVENLVRTPIGPDGSKGFVGSRARKFGQTVSPVN